jgi:hypothetical protein
METKQIDINIAAAIPTSRGIGSQLGSLVGQPYYKVDSRNTWQGGDEGWNADNEKARLGTFNGLLPNRKINKYRVEEHDIFGAQYYKQPITGEIGIVVNLNPQDGTYDMFFPLAKDSLKIGRGAAEAIAAALKGEGENFFLNPQVVVNVVNEANRAEVNNIDAFISVLNKIKQNLLTTISQNDKLASNAIKERNDSKIDDIDLQGVLKGNGSATIEINA